MLNNAYADGRLDYEEHSERITRAYNAKTFGDLDHLTQDLIPPSAAHAPMVAQPTSNAPVPAEAFAGGRAILGDFKPGGPLVMPQFSEVTCILGDARIDLVGATFTARETTIRVNAMLGEVRIRVPEGVRVISHVSTMLGDFKSNGVSADDARVVLVVEGTSFLADVKVLGPEAPQRKYDRFV